MDYNAQSLPNPLEIHEIQEVFEALYYASWLLLAFVMIILILHILFDLTGSSALYAKRSPKPNWGKNFYPAILMLTIVVGATVWTLYNLSLGIIIWA